MASEDVVFRDIFHGADKVEILGKLPSILWAYIERARTLIKAVNTTPDDCAQIVTDTKKIVGILESAADQLGNEELKSCIGDHATMLARLAKGGVSPKDFIESFNSRLPKLEELAGPRPESLADGTINAELLEQELDRAERIKAGRSADIVVSVELLDDIRSFLTQEVMTEGISTILVIDNAGTLIVNVGDKIDLDAVSLAAVAAANFAATERIARLIGEQDFVLLFYKGHNESFHFSRVGNRYIIVTIFDNSLSLGLLRLKIAESSQMLEKKLPKSEG